MAGAPASILTVSAAERSLAFWSRVAICHGIKPLSHPAVRQPRSSDKMDLIPSGADGRASLFRRPLSRSRGPITHRRPCMTGPRGYLLNTARRCACKPTDAPDWSIGCEPPQGGVRQKRDCMRPKKTILCVDDNEQVLSVRTFLLETRGYRIIAVNTAQEALEVLERSLPGTLDLILCDLLMPQMDGNELVRRAKQLHQGLPAMIVSGTVNAFDRALHADVFLPKGASSPAEMIERIRVLVARKRGPKKAAAAASTQPADISSFAHATAS